MGLRVSCLEGSVSSEDVSGMNCLLHARQLLILLLSTIILGEPANACTGMNFEVKSMGFWIEGLVFRVSG